MKSLIPCVLLALVVAGCSGRAAFEQEILGAPPQTPPPATSAGSNVGRPAGEPVPAGATPHPSVSTTSGEPVAAREPAPYKPAPVPPAPVAQPAQGTPVQPAPAAAPAASAKTHSPYAAAPAAPAQTPGLRTYQVGSFAHEANAVSLRDMLVARGHQSTIDQGQTSQGKPFFRVYAQMPGTEAEAKAALAALGVTEPTPVDGNAKRPASQTSAASAKTPVPPASTQSGAAASAPGTATGTPTSAVISGPTGQCHVDASRISTTGVSRTDAGEPLMAQKAAAQNAKRNLLLCVDAYKRKAEKIPDSIKMEGYLPDTLVTYTSPAYLPDGAVEVGASMSVGDVDAVAFTRLE